MLKITRSPNKLAFSRNNGSKLAFSKSNNSRPTSKKNDSDGKVNRFGINRNGIKYAKNLKKLSKSRKSKSKKIFKFWNLAKSGKKLLKCENSTNFDILEAEPKF